MTLKTPLLLKTLFAAVSYPSIWKEVLSAAFVQLVEATKRKHVESQYSLYGGLPTIDILDLCPGLNEQIHPYTYLEGTSLPTDLALLKSLAKGYKECQYLEIGTWRGESILNVLKATSDCTSLSLSAPQMAALNFPKEFIDQNRIFIDDDKAITSIYANSLEFDFSSVDKKFDLIFVDGDHSYHAVKNDTSKVFSLLKDENSIIIWHDYAFNPERIRYSVLAGILDGCSESKRKYLYHVSNTMCAIYTKKSYPVSKISFPSIPNKKFTVNVSAVSWTNNM